MIAQIIRSTRGYRKDKLITNAHFQELCKQIGYLIEYGENIDVTHKPNEMKVVRHSIGVTTQFIVL